MNEAGKNICFSGGADGADSIFGECADRIGHRVCHYGFNGHRSSCPFHWILTGSQLEIADPYLIEANKTLERGNFKNYSPYVKNLMRRNYWIIKDASVVYAVSKFKYDQSEVLGGTGWGVQLANDLAKDVWFYDMVSKSWYEYMYYDEGSWRPAVPKNYKPKPPFPKGFYAGIGTRELTDDGKNAIINLFRE